MTIVSYESMPQYLSYIRPQEDQLLQCIRDYGKANDIPIIRDEMKQFMDVFLLVHRPLKVLEVGTAIGYSSIAMATAMSSYCTHEEMSITTIERSDTMIALAVENIKQSRYDDCIELVHEDASDVLEAFVKEGKTFDLIFMDAAKGQYMTFLPSLLDMLLPGGVLVSDNVLQDGDLVKSRFNVARRNRTIHQRMREYLWTLNHHPSLKTSVMTIADGVTVSVKL